MTTALALITIGALALIALALLGRCARRANADRRALTGELDRGEKRHSALLRVAQAVARGTSHERVCRLVTDEASGLLGVPAVCIARIDSPETATIVTATGMAPEAGAAAPAVIGLAGDDSVVARVATQGRPVTIGPYPSSAEPRAEYLRTHFAEGAGVPIVAGSDVWGVLAVARPVRSPPFPPDTLESLEEFARWVGLGVVNADLQLRHRTEGLLTTLVDAVPMGIMFLSDDLRVVRLNESAVAHYGSSFAGQHIDGLFPPEFAEMCRFALNAGEGFRATLLWDRVRRGGAQILTVDVRPVRLGDSPALGLAVLSEDASGWGELEASQSRMRDMERQFREKAEAAVRDLLAGNEEIRDAQRRLARQAELLSAVTALEPDGVFAMDLDGRFTFLNEAAAIRLGTSREAAIGRRIDDFLPVEAAAALRANGRSALATGAPTMFENELGPPGQITRWLFILAPYVLDGEVLGLAGIARDVTEHHDSERSTELILARERVAQRVAHDSIRRLEEQNSRLLELDHSKDEILALISHDLRTPLTSILGYAELYLRDAERVEPRHRRYVEVVARNSQKLVDLLDDLLLVAHYNAGGLTISPEHVDIGPLVIQCAEAAIPMAKKKRILVTHDVGPDLMALADPRRLVQLLDNLISNAIKYTEPDGFIDVAARRTGGKIVLRVRDNGPGIGLEEQRRIFERFTRARDAAHGGVRGFGLGLTIANAIAEAHGGRIGVDSMPGTGSTFWVELDHVPENATSDVTASTPGSA